MPQELEGVFTTVNSVHLLFVGSLISDQLAFERTFPLTWYFYPFFMDLASLMNADIVQDLRSLVCSCLNSYVSVNCKHNHPPRQIFKNCQISAPGQIFWSNARSQASLEPLILIKSKYLWPMEPPVWANLFLT